MATRAIIGGESELASPFRLGAPPALEALTRGLAGDWLASGRAALARVCTDLAATRDLRRVHLPSYLCDSVVAGVQAADLEIAFYPVDAQLLAHPDVDALADDEALLLIHYFGWLDPATAVLRGRAAAGSYMLLEDYSHAALSDWSVGHRGPNTFAFFSARKLGPLPVGGWATRVAEAEERSTPGVSDALAAVYWRSLAARAIKADYLRDLEAPPDHAVETLYLEAFAAVEAHLDTHPADAVPPKDLAALAAGIDWAAAAERRRANWLRLHGALADLTIGPPAEGRGGVHPRPESSGLAAIPFYDALPERVVPLGYLVRLPDRDTRDALRRALAARRIFCPVHWPLPAAVPEDPAFDVARILGDTLLTLPIDQRYGPKDMQRLAAAVAEEVRSLPG